MNDDHALDVIRGYFLENARTFGLRKMGLFGSLARHAANDNSDVDIVVDLDSSDYAVLARIKNDLEALLGRRVDIVRKRKNMNQLLRQRIDEEAVYV